ncbi:asparagine synthetase B [Solimonas sp. SE-A11]|uniref:asparagine synthetase B family protein n=1 Tax=Solimonas sp. SE-A11 TaxID=3054954 RepID=UPI00259CF379|nr:asparagine synthase-related protein [Solimonas sp. SE-A11]MDM4769038.1 asparagine synthase-related protein [Solimonas sp. SE-A11]
MFAGLITIAPGTEPQDFAEPAALSAALAPYHRPDREGCWQQGPALLLAQRQFNAPQSRDPELPLRCGQTGVVLAFWGRLDNREQLAAALALDRQRLASLADSELVLATWQRWGEALPLHLVGDFALAVVDAARRRVFLARDAVGIKPLYYRHDASVFAFASSAAALRTLRGLPLTPDPEWMAQYLLHLSNSPERSGYRELHKLPPGHSLSVDAEGRATLSRWHHWRDDAPDAHARDPRWVEQYRAQLEEAIRCRMPSDYPLGTENSGGIDSATVTAYLARFLGDPGDRLHSFAFALCEQEPAYILETSQAAGVRHNYVITARSDEAETPDQVLERTLRVLGLPEEHSNGSGHTPFYREAQARGIRTLYSGFGGDEVVTNPASHVRLELLDAGRYEQLQELLPGNALTRRLRVAKMLLTSRKSPAYNPDFWLAWNERWPHQPLRAEVVAAYGLREAYFATAIYDAPYRRTNDFILQHLLQQAFIPARLESCTLAAASWGIEYRWPLWDARLVQQYLSTPSIEKRGPGRMGRYLHRRAIDGVVPQRVAWKPSKDMGAPSSSSHLGLATEASARRHQALLHDLHPALVDLVDVARLRAQLGISFAQGSAGALIGQHFTALHMLNRWLHGHAGPA